MKNRIREIASELIKIAAERQLREAPRLASRPGSTTSSAPASPTRRPTTSSPPSPPCSTISEFRPADGPADLRRRRLRQDRGGVARRLRRGDERQAGRGRGADHAAGAPAHQDLSDRLRGYPVHIAQASRLVSAKPSSPNPKKGLAEGQIDIVVGTHALLGKAIKFKDLGLVVVDEEQHFGVAHKEKLKRCAPRCMC
jgi:transcription-repair coupling factor (superfamily II helicase)